MNEKRQNEIVCELLEWSEANICPETADFDATIFLYQGARGGIKLSWFTRSHENLHLMRAALIERGLWNPYILHLGHIVGADWDCDTSDPNLIRLMQAKPAQQVEAAIRALGLLDEAS